MIFERKALSIENLGFKGEKDLYKRYQMLWNRMSNLVILRKS